MANNLTAEMLRAIIDYDPLTGRLTNLVYRGKAVPGAAAGSVDKAGYVTVSIYGKKYRAHRLAFLWMTGDWPEIEVDHRDQDKANNRWKNLRDVSKSINSQNERRARPQNASGLLGVSWHKRIKKYAAGIIVGGRRRHLGYFPDPVAAHQVYIKAKRELHEGCTI